MGKFKTGVQTFLHKHSMPIIAVLLVVAAIVAGTVQVKISDINAASDVGHAGGASNVIYPSGNASKFVQGPEIAVTPKVYDYGSLVENATGSFGKKGSRAIKKYSEKVAAVANNKSKLIKSGDGWDVHSDPSNLYNSIITISNAQRRDMVSTTISNRADHYTDGSMIFIPKSTVNKQYGDIHAYSQTVVGYKLNDKRDTKSRLIFDGSDNGLSSFFDGVSVKGNSDSQRTYNKSILQDKVIGSNSNGIFMSKIREMEKNNKSAGKNNPQLSYTGKDGKTHKYEYQASDMLYISQHLTELLKYAQQNDSAYSKSLKLFALATNVYESGGNLYTCPKTLQDYVSIVTKNSIKNYKDKTDDLNRIMKDDTKHLMQTTLEGKDDPDGSDVGTREYEMYKEILKDGDISGNLFGNQTSKTDSIVAQYIQGEYNMSYLDMLLCGYSIACHREGNSSAAAHAWKKAITAFVDSVNDKSGKNNSVGAQGKVVMIRFDLGLMSKTGSMAFHHTSNGTMAMTVFGLGGGADIDTKNKTLNSKTMIKSFIGIQTKGHADSKLVFNGNNYITTYREATGSNLNSYYKRLGTAATKAHPKTKNMYTNFSSYSLGIVNRLYNMSEIGAKVYDTTTPGKAGSEDYIELLKNGLTDKDGGMFNLKKSYNYGTYATVAMSWWDTKSETANPPGYELRIYSTKAHATKQGEDLEDNKNPTTGKLPKDGKEANGNQIHSTAETVKITATKSGTMTLTDDISLKIDVPAKTTLDDNATNFKEIVNSDKAKVKITYSASENSEDKKLNAKELAKTDPSGSTMSLASTKGYTSDRGYQDKKQIDFINDDGEGGKYTFESMDIDESNADATGVKVVNNAEKYNTATLLSNNKKEILGVSDGKIDGKITGYSDYYASADPKSDWTKLQGTKNLVWQTGFNEMEKDGFGIEVPDVKEGETWVHYYRVCVVAKVEIYDKDGKTYYFKKTDSNGKKVPDKEKSVNYTNPVYITYKVTYKPSSTPKFEFYGDMGSIDNSDSVKAHAYSEFKEGSVYNETFEAMAGVPSTRTMYFATGGEEFMVNLQAVYDDYVAKKGSTVGEEGENVDPNAYKAVRKYTVHFNGVDCEYKEGDTFKSGQGPRNTKQETFVADSNDKKEKKQVNAQINNCYSIPGGGTGNVTTKDHGTTTEIYAEWTGTIGNTSKLNKSGANKNPTGKPCESGDAGDFYTCSPTTGWNTTTYNDAVKNARDWATKMSGTSAGGTILRKDDSDGYERIYHCGEAKVVITLSGGGDGGKDLHTGARTIPDSREFDKSVSGGEIAMNSSSLGSGWSWHKGKKATPTGECKDICDSKGNVTGHVHKSWTGYEASSDSKAPDVSFTIKVTFPKAYIDAKNFDGNSSNVTLSKIDAGNGIPAHAMCGACCQHVLPAIEDTWTQKVRYDTVRFSALQVWKLDDGYAGDVSSSQSSSDTDEDDSGDEEDEGETDTSDGGSGDTDSEMYTLKHKTDGNGTGAESYGSGTAAGVDSDTSIPGNGDGSVRPITGNESEYVRSKIVRYDPNIFYNIATSETSKAGRLRYSLQRGQDDDVYYEEMGDPQRSGGQTRDNLCDGQIDAGEGMSNHGASPLTVTKKGHKITFSKGCLYSNSTYSNDMHHNDNPKKSTTKYANWSDDIDPNKTTVGPVAETKTTYTNNTADAIDKESTEWKRFEARRAQPNEVKVISDFLILQTSSGDQSMFYYDNDGKTLKTTRCDENFPDDFWYSKPASSDYIKKSGGGRWYVENTPAAQSAWAEMWDNNPLRFDCNTMQVNMGGYNGQYANVDTKYNGTGHDEVVKTDFDDDYEYFNGASNDDMKSGNSHGAKANASGFKSRDGRDCPAAEIYNSSSKAAHSRNIESKSKQSADQRATCNSDSDVMYGYDDGYISSPGCGNVGESGNSLDTGLEGSARAEHNTYDFYKAPTKQSAWGSYIYGHNENGQTVRWNNRIPDPGVAKFGSARFVLLQDGISLNPTIKNTLYNTGLSFAFYKPILRYQNKAADSSDMIKSYYGTQNHTGENYNIVELHEAVNDYEFHIKNETDPYLNKAGVTYASVYTDGQTKVNNIIIHDPVSVQYSKVIGADKSYDQRIYGDDKSSAKTASEEESDSETCPGTAEDCIFRVLNCKYAQRIRRAAFDIDHATRQLYDPEDDDSGTYDTIESTVMSDKTYPSIDLTGSGFTLAMDNGSTYTGDEAEDEDGNVTSYTAKHLKGSRGASLEFQWAAFGVDTTRRSERYEVGGDFTFDGTGQEALFATDGTKVTRLSNGKIQIETDDGTYTSAETVGSGKHEILYRFAFDSVLFKDVTIKVGGKTYKIEANTGVKVDGKDLTFTGPEQKGTNYYVSNAGSGFYIGNAPGKELDASYSIDNIRVDRLAGSASHTAGCFTIGQEVHEKTRQNYYNGTGKLSTGKIDWTSEYDDGSMSRVSINNKHTHTEKCLSSVSEGLKIAIQEASAGNTTDLRKELGEKVWNKVKDKLSECYGDDGSTVAVGQTTTYGYTGGTQKVTLVPGTYQLEAYGAKGGNDSQAGGNGGYAKGKLKVDKATDIYIAAGGKGADAATGNGGGYNGGGNAGRSGSSGGGGGATSISLANGTLKNVMASDRTNVLLVAGGGGGGGNARTDSTTRSDSGYVTYGRERATNAIHTFTAQASGTVYFWSQNCNNDPWGTIKIYRNGQLVTTKEDDDGGRGTDPDGVPFGPNSRGSYFNFNMSTSFQQGDYVELWVGSYSPSYDNNYCTWHYKYNGTRTIDGKGGTGGGVSGGDGEGMNENAYGGSSNHASYKGYGGDCRAADGGGGGGGFYGGYGAQEDAGAGGGSGYTSPRLIETTMSNGVNSGNGYAKIKVLELKTYSPKKVLNVIKNVIGGDVSQIPSYVTTDGHTIVNPIWVCEGKYDEHVCTDNCKTLKNGKVDVTLDCSEPHHTGEHYDAGDPICYDPCNDDAKHKAAAEGKVKYDRDGKPTSDNGTDDDSRFIRLDNYFTVYYPCLGDFADTNDHGIAWCEQSRGMGYVNSMDCVEWTREKWIRFPYSTLYYRESIGKWEEHPADEWYQVDVGYEDSAGNYHPYNYYKFYCQLRNKEISMGKVEFMVEAINDVGPDESPYGYETPYGRDDIFAQDCPEDNTWNTNKDRFSGADGPDAVSPTYTAYHSVYKSYLIDVVGRIGNLLFEDSTDWRFSNFFKQASTPLKWNQDGIAYEVNKAKQNMYYSWHLNNDDTAEDIRTQKVTPNIQWYNTYSTLKWTDVGNAMYKAAPTPLEAWKNYTHQDQYFQETYGKDVSTYLEQTHMQFGYDLLWDISTIGNYHEGNLQIEPKYYAFDTWTKKVIPVDVHMSDGEDTKTINYFGLMDEYGTKRYDEYSAKLYHYNMNLDWKHERKERNATGDEWANTLKVSEAYANYLYDGDGNLITGSDGEPLTVNLDIPHGENYSLGDIQFQYLNRGRTATFFGSSRVPALNSGTYDNTDKYTKTLNNGINGDIDEELWHEYGVLGAEGGKNDVKDTEYMLNGQRWHTRLGLPSNVRFTSASDKNGDGLPDHVSPDALTTDENGNTIREWEKFDNNEIEKKTGRRRYVILETATITAIGDPWDLRYDQKENNGHITVGSKYTGGETYTYYFEQTHDEKNSIWDFPTLLAVYDNDIPTDSDYDTLQTH